MHTQSLPLLAYRWRNSSQSVHRSCLIKSLKYLHSANSGLAGPFILSTYTRRLHRKNAHTHTHIHTAQQANTHAYTTQQARTHTLTQQASTHTHITQQASTHTHTHHAASKHTHIYHTASTHTHTHTQQAHIHTAQQTHTSLLYITRSTMLLAPACANCEHVMPCHACMCVSMCMHTPARVCVCMCVCMW